MCAAAAAFLEERERYRQIIGLQHAVPLPRHGLEINRAVYALSRRGNVSELVCSVDKNAPISVHLADFPVADTGKVNKDLSADTQLAMRFVVSAERPAVRPMLRFRQPLGQALIRVNSVRERDGLIRIMPQILEEPM